MGIDIYPTLLDLAGIAPPSGHPLDGHSLKPLLEGNPGFDREAIFWHFPAYLQGEYGMTQVWRTTPVSGIRKGRYKLLEFLDDGSLELYDLKNDLREERNLVLEDPEKTSELFGLLQEWRSRYKVPYPLEPNPEYDPSTVPGYFKSQERSDIYKTGLEQVK